ncbi:MAG: hypothetical protein M1133_12145 [Armatimonadetes bacterium]|nr:hypothetical protein [Armatimonadota bacterium]
MLQETFSLVRDKLWVLNDDFWHTGQHERCIAMMRLITQIDPHDFDAYEDGAWLMESDMRDDEAEAFLLQGLRNNPDTYNMYSAMGYFCYMHNRMDESIAYYEKAVLLDAPNLTWHMLAHAYEQGGYVNESLDVWRGLEVIEPGNVVPRMQIDRILKGEPPPDIPGFLSRAREERKSGK